MTLLLFLNECNILYQYCCICQVHLWILCNKSTLHFLVLQSINVPRILLLVLYINIRYFCIFCFLIEENSCGKSHSVGFTTSMCIPYSDPVLLNVVMMRKLGQSLQHLYGNVNTVGTSTVLVTLLSC